MIHYQYFLSYIIPNFCFNICIIIPIPISIIVVNTNDQIGMFLIYIPLSCVFKLFQIFSLKIRSKFLISKVISKPNKVYYEIPTFFTSFCFCFRLARLRALSISLFLSLYSFCLASSSSLCS